MKHAPDRRAASDRVLVLLFLFPLLLLILLPLRGQKDVSDEENRTLERFPALTASGLLSGTYQDALEEAISDQLLLSGPVKAAVQDGENTLLKAERRALAAIFPGLRTRYEQLTDGYFHYASDLKRIVERPKDYSACEARLKRFAEPYNHLSSIRRYLYFIENSRVIDFDDPTSNGAIYRMVRGAFELDGADVFSVRDYQDYCARFYQTDHHWNQRGAYEGYLAILRLMKGGEAAPVPLAERVELPVVFNGSYARQTRTLCATEHFEVSSFDLPRHTVAINGKRGTYGHLSAYLRGKYPADAMRNHYAYCFGGDYALLEYDFQAPGKGNLLLVASSYSNPINALIASHFDRTFVVDPRYYEAFAGAPFDPEAFVRENGIDTLLLLGDVNMFLLDEKEEGAGR